MSRNPERTSQKICILSPEAAERFKHDGAYLHHKMHIHYSPAKTRLGLAVGELYWLDEERRIAAIQAIRGDWFKKKTGMNAVGESGMSVMQMRTGGRTIPARLVGGGLVSPR